MEYHENIEKQNKTKPAERRLEYLNPHRIPEVFKTDSTMVNNVYRQNVHTLNGVRVYLPVPNTMGLVQNRIISAQCSPMLVRAKRNLDYVDAGNNFFRRHKLKTVTTCISKLIPCFNLFVKFSTSQTIVLSRVHTKVVLL
jgi:hypothetical protein